MINEILAIIVIAASIIAPIVGYVKIWKLPIGRIKTLLAYLYYAFIFFCAVYFFRSIGIIYHVTVDDTLTVLGLFFNIIGVVIGVYTGVQFLKYANTFSFKPILKSKRK